jgi:ABC-type sugar transport system ATPase subunit
MNFIHCKASVKDGGLCLSNDGFDITLQIANSKEIPEDVILGIRPEDVKLNVGEVGMSAKILVVESTRPEMLVHLAVKNTPIAALVPATSDLRPQLETKITFNMRSLRLFSAETQKSIELVWNGRSKN